MRRWRSQAYRTMALKLHPDKRKSTQREGACASGPASVAGAQTPLCATSALLVLTDPRPLRAVAEREFNLLQKAYEMLWCAAAVALFAPRP